MLEQSNSHLGLIAGLHRRLGQTLVPPNWGSVVPPGPVFGLGSRCFIVKQRFEQGFVAVWGEQACGICGRNNDSPQGDPCEDCNRSSDQRQGAIAHGHSGLGMAIMLTSEIACSMPLIRFIHP